MRKTVLCAIPAILLLMSCTEDSKPQQTAVSNDAGSATGSCLTTITNGDDISGLCQEFAGLSEDIVDEQKQECESREATNGRSYSWDDAPCDTSDSDGRCVIPQDGTIDKVLIFSGDGFTPDIAEASCTAQGGDYESP
ncbi:MAG: hypothetical protein HRU19_16395 [Pseudobacteriovorax sp.]|nr:hypothetical protein [Pseudobacteriovorax sp.]